MKTETKVFLIIASILVLCILMTGCNHSGPEGAAGAQGNPGASIVGPQGPAGVDGTQIQVVQFCPGVTTYPAAFLEIGMIISGKLYAVYSANNGFLTELPPGTYSSNAVGSACNFVVNADLTISN